MTRTSIWEASHYSKSPLTGNVAEVFFLHFTVSSCNMDHIMSTWKNVLISCSYIPVAGARNSFAIYQSSFLGWEGIDNAKIHWQSMRWPWTEIVTSREVIFNEDRSRESPIYISTACTKRNHSKCSWMRRSITTVWLFIYAIANARMLSTAVRYNNIVCVTYYGNTEFTHEQI